MRATHLEYLGFNPNAADANAIPTGGTFVTCVADAGQTLKTGDVVYFSAVGGKVSTSAIAATVGPKFAGVVIGGDSLFDIQNDISLANPSLKTGLTAATAAQKVLIQITGITRVVAGAAIAGASRVISGATAGQVAIMPGVAPQFTLGIALETAAVQGDVIKLLLQYNYIFQ